MDIMTPTMQRGYDDQMGSRINADLFCADTNDAREYRAGARAARRELMDKINSGVKELAEGIRTAAGVVAVLTEAQAMENEKLLNPLIAVRQEIHPTDFAGQTLKKYNSDVVEGLAQVAIKVGQAVTTDQFKPHAIIVIDDPSPHEQPIIATPLDATPNAFSDPTPGRKRRAKAQKDDGQLGLL